MGDGIRPFGGSLERLNALREPVHPLLESFITVLAAPRGFWGPTSATEMGSAPVDEILAAFRSGRTDDP